MLFSKNQKYTYLYCWFEKILILWHKWKQNAKQMNIFHHWFDVSIRDPVLTSAKTAMQYYSSVSLMLIRLDFPAKLTLGENCQLFSSDFMYIFCAFLCEKWSYQKSQLWHCLHFRGEGAWIWHILLQPNYMITSSKYSGGNLVLLILGQHPGSSFSSQIFAFSPYKLLEVVFCRLGRKSLLYDCILPWTI